MNSLSKRITWFLFLLLGWIILIINGHRDKKIHITFLQELKELCKKHSKYTEDSGWTLVRRELLKNKKE